MLADRDQLTPKLKVFSLVLLEAPRRIKRYQIRVGWSRLSRLQEDKR